MYDEIIPVMADANLIVQVIVNLMDNAVKYSDEDSDVTVSVRRENAHTVVISVSDHAPVSPMKKKKRYLICSIRAAAFLRQQKKSGAGACTVQVNYYFTRRTISVSDNIPNGTVVSFTLPIGEVDLNE